MNTEPEVRIGDAERDAAVASLGEHYAAGRLTREEYDERSDLALKARTAAQLRPLFADLPGPRPDPRPNPEPWAARARHPGRRPGWPVPVLPLVFVLVGLSLLLHFPVWLFFLVAWLCLAGPFRRRTTGWRRRW
jgi:Domain of unknown function (DUF1707)